MQNSRCVFWSRALFLGLILWGLIVTPATAYDTNNRRTPIVTAIEQVGPAVVNIFTEEAPRQTENPFRGFMADHLFEKYFEDFYQQKESDRRSLGSGVIIDP